MCCGGTQVHICKKPSVALQRSMIMAVVATATVTIVIIRYITKLSTTRPVNHVSRDELTPVKHCSSRMGLGGATRARGCTIGRRNTILAPPVYYMFMRMRFRIELGTLLSDHFRKSYRCTNEPKLTELLFCSSAP